MFVVYHLKHSTMEVREGTVTDNAKKIKDKKTKQKIDAENPAKLNVKDNDEVKYITYLSHDNGGQKVVHVIKDKK